MVDGSNGTLYDFFQRRDSELKKYFCLFLLPGVPSKLLVYFFHVTFYKVSDRLYFSF